MTDKTDREIMHQAMVALDSKHDMTKAEWRYLQYHAFNDLRERLAQPEQEPVAWMYTSHWKGDERFITRYQSELTAYKADKVWPLYTAPQQREWQGLTNEEIQTTWDSVMDGAVFTRREVYKAIEAKLKEKND